MVIQAKFKCISSSRIESCETVKLSPVYSSDKSHPNYTWSQATPSGEITLSITNSEVFGKIVPGRQYLIDFTDAS